MKRKNLKYRDLPLEMQNIAEIGYGHIQRAQNPTVNHMLKRIKEFQEKYQREGAVVSVKEKRIAYKKLSDFQLKWQGKQSDKEALIFFKKNPKEEFFKSSYGFQHFRPFKI